ncbi:MAG: thiamine phosphate synthase [Clostridia bacterium]|nr:thiamine phosphate synthase [Clostridia bacterium]NCC75219.1 thiamine phosphate synthase [Clostridia bacterium]
MRDLQSPAIRGRAFLLPAAGPKSATSGCLGIPRTASQGKDFAMEPPDFTRLLDANLNRICEGLRVLEDFFRFAAPEPELAERCKSLRHRVRHEPGRLKPDLPDLLWTHRDAESDCGPAVSLRLQDQGEIAHQYSTIRDFLTANCKRIQEGLRSLAEAGRMLDQSGLACFFEDMRYQSYALESDCLAAVANEPRTRLAAALRGLYGVASPEPATGRSALASGLDLLAAGVFVLQYRNKTADTVDQLADCQVLAAACHERGALLIVNDRVDIALASGADGVHLGQEDLPVGVARQLAAHVRPGQPFWIGQSTHNPEQARAAADAGCDYIGIGPVFATTTKADLRVPVAGLEYVHWSATTLDLPHVAIGGISPGNFEQVFSAGARCCAMISAINQESDLVATARLVQAQMLALL